jgi:hypothetical protein
MLFAISVSIFFYRHKLRWNTVFRFLKKAVIAALVIVFIINLCYYFADTFVPFSKFKFESIGFQQLQKQFSWFGFIRVPLPSNYVYALDMLHYQQEYGGGKYDSTYSGIFINGNYTTHGSFWFFYLLEMLYKFPLIILLLLLMFVFLSFNIINKSTFFQTYIFIIIPVTWFLVILSFFNPFQTGIRHIILIIPLLYLCAGLSIQHIVKQWRFKPVIWITLAYFVVSLIVYHPYYFAYTNEIISNKKLVYKKLADSSINYGQNDSAVAKHLKLEPILKTPTAQPDTGWFIVNIDAFVNLRKWPQWRYDWLQNNFEPVNVYEYVNLVFHITDEDLKRKGLSR